MDTAALVDIDPCMHLISLPLSTHVQPIPDPATLTPLTPEVISKQVRPS